jgi:5-dehydro-2-deoxygluconokinase
VTERRLDLISMGRAAVDLYAEQIGARLEDARTMAKSLGGCAGNVAVGAARLGLRVAMLTRVGDEAMGRFVEETLEAEGVDTSHVRTDPDRLTGLVLLGLCDRETFPLIFYRRDCADMAIQREDVDPDFLASAKALLVTGTHLSTEAIQVVTHRAIDLARAAGTRIVLDVDYRPVLWGAVGLGLGEDRATSSERATRAYERVLPGCDLVVGTEEEIRVAGGGGDTHAALLRIRARTAAPIVVKRGPRGGLVVPGPIPARLEDALGADGFPVEVLNVLGAGDAFLAGFLSGWLREAPLSECLRRGNAAGALVVTRHGCAPAMPSAIELEDFLARAAGMQGPARDPRLAHLHRVTTRRSAPPELWTLAFDHRSQLEQAARVAGAPLERLRALKVLLVRAVRQVAERRDARRLGVIVDDRWGQDALFALVGAGLWVGRPIELPGSEATDEGLAFEGGRDVGVTLRSWPTEHVVKCLVAVHPDGPKARSQEALLLQLQEAAHATGHELLLEPIPTDASVLPRALARLYEIGLRPDWWKLPPQRDPAAWGALGALVTEQDPHCRGIVILGLDAPEEELAASFAAAAGTREVRGFAVGRTIFGEPASQWLAGAIDDAALVAEIARRFERLIAAWGARGG